MFDFVLEKTESNNCNVKMALDKPEDKLKNNTYDVNFTPQNHKEVCQLPFFFFSNFFLLLMEKKVAPDDDDDERRKK